MSPTAGRERPGKWPVRAVLGCTAFLVAITLLVESGGGSHADDIDRPAHIDVIGSSTVLLGFRTDISDSGVVRYFDARSGRLLALWTTDGAVEGIGWSNSGVFVNMAEEDRLARFDDSGVFTDMWPVQALMPHLAVGITGRSLVPSVYVLTEGERTEVVRLTAPDQEVARWPVIGSAYDLAWSPLDGPEGSVQVAVVDLSTPAGAFVVRYTTDGQELGDFSVDGEVHGIDVDSAGRTVVGLVPERSLYGNVSWFQDGDRVATCAVPGYPIDIAASSRGAWVIVRIREGSAAHQIGQEERVMHLDDDCTLLANWGYADWSVFATPTGSRTVHASGTPTGSRTTEPSLTPTTTYTNPPPATPAFAAILPRVLKQSPP